MCTPTNELKLCTCKFGKTFPHNYRILHRFTSKNLETMGELICGYNKDLITAAEIALFISASINTANCFDKNLSIKNKDVLEITPYIIRLNIYTITGFLKASELKLKKLMPSKLRMITTGYRKGITKPKLSSMVKNL